MYTEEQMANFVFFATYEVIRENNLEGVYQIDLSTHVVTPTPTDPHFLTLVALKTACMIERLNVRDILSNNGVKSQLNGMEIKRSINKSVQKALGKFSSCEQYERARQKNLVDRAILTPARLAYVSQPSGVI